MGPRRVCASRIQLSRVVVNTHFTAAVTRMYALRFLHDVRSVWAPVMEALGQVHPSARWDHDEYLHSLSAERLVCLVQAQHQQLCFTGQIIHALYQQFPRYLAKPPFMLSFASIRKSITTDIFRQPPALDLSADDAKCGLVPAAQLMALHLRHRVATRAAPGSDIAPQLDPATLSAGADLRAQLVAFLTVPMPEVVVNPGGQVGMDYVALAHSLFTYALALNVTAPTLPAFREKRQSDDWQLQWYVFANTFTVRCAPIVAMSPASGLGLALSRLAASVSVQLALASPMPQLHLGKV